MQYLKRKNAQKNDRTFTLKIHWFYATKNKGADITSDPLSFLFSVPQKGCFYITRECKNKTLIISICCNKILILFLKIRKNNTDKGVVMSLYFTILT